MEMSMPEKKHVLFKKHDDGTMTAHHVTLRHDGRSFNEVSRVEGKRYRRAQDADVLTAENSLTIYNPEDFCPYKVIEV